jgi:membrane-bound lytic murein transglycosylase B
MIHMIRRTRLALLMLIVLTCAVGAAARAQAPEPPEVIVAIHQVAPGKHLDFLKWLAANDAIAKEAGVPGGQVYAHTNGDSWDYLVITPVLSDAQDAKVEEITKKRGQKTGFAASLEFRTFIATHTDTQAIGPLSAAELVAMAGK